MRTAVALVRETRRHPKLRKGASVRAAIAMTAIAERLEGGPDALLEAALAALTTRVELKDEEEADLRSIVREILEGIKKKPLTR